MAGAAAWWTGVAAVTWAAGPAELAAPAAAHPALLLQTAAAARLQSGVSVRSGAQDNILSKLEEQMAVC